MRLIVGSVILLLTASDALAAQGTITGKERTGWQTGYYNVVVAIIRNVEKDKAADAGSSRYRAVLSPKATLGGTLDPSLYPSLPAAFYVGKAVGAIEEAPPDGSLVMVVMQLDREDAADKPFAFIFSDICKFMPGESAMVLLKGLDDPLAAETLMRLQDARAHADPVRKATPPAADKR
jgi:hypothetical protein